MAGKKSTSIQNPFPPSLLWAVRLLVLAAAVISAYLGWVSWQGVAVAGCGPESGCHKVLQSRWAYWFGLPVSFPALLLYLGVLGASFGLAPNQPASLQRKIWSFLVPASWLMICVVVWFVSLQLIIVRALCPYCMTAHALAGAAAVILLLNAPYGHAPEKAKDQERAVFIPPRLSRRLFLAGMAGFFGVLAGQTLYQRPTYQETPITLAVTNAPRRETPTTPAVTNIPPRHTLELFGGKFVLDLTDVPLLGKPSAPHAILGLFDYTCHHCREMHPNLIMTQKLLSNELSIVHLPMPLDERCNPAIKVGGTPPEHREACDYARIGLTLWRANREHMHTYDDWFFQFQKPPPLAAAEAYARKLAGTEAFEAAARDPWIGRQLSNDVAIYLTSKQEYKVGNMPQLIVGTNIFGGTLTSNQLLYLMNTRLGITSAIPTAPYNPLAPTNRRDKP